MEGSDQVGASGDKKRLLPRAVREALVERTWKRWNREAVDLTSWANSRGRGALRGMNGNVEVVILPAFSAKNCLRDLPPAD
jgi:hypothetical protein